MDLVQLTEEIVKSLVMDTDAVSVKEFPTEEENVMLIQVIVAEDDMGRVIGKGGRCANAIRTLVQASSALKDNKYIKIDIDKFQKAFLLSFFFFLLYNNFEVEE